jgi:hypothetical protein
VTIDEPAAGQRDLNPESPHSARVWNYFLGGKDNFQADRAMGDQIKAAFPDIVVVAQESRRFLARAVGYLAGEVGIRQFLDIGTGLPTADNTHQVAQRIAPDSRIVYVDNDPLVLVHARALLSSSPEGVTDYLDADLREPEKILAGAAQTLNFHQPIAVMLLGILGHIVDYDEARALVSSLMAGVPSGSYLVINDGTNVVNPEARNEATRISIESGEPYISRQPDDIARYFTGLNVVEPGVVSSSRWRPGTETLPDEVDVYCGVASKP